MVSFHDQADQIVAQRILGDGRRRRTITLTKPTLKLCSTFTKKPKIRVSSCDWYHGRFVEQMTTNQMDDTTSHESYNALDRERLVVIWTCGVSR